MKHEQDDGHRGHGHHRELARPHSTALSPEPGRTDSTSRRLIVRAVEAEAIGGMLDLDKMELPFLDALCRETLRV